MIQSKYSRTGIDNLQQTHGSEESIIAWQAWYKIYMA
jgi:hypothetical protein